MAVLHGHKVWVKPGFAGNGKYQVFPAIRVDEAEY
jgi:hypothetical protein